MGPERFSKVVKAWASIPLTEKIFVRGQVEKYNLTLRPNYFPGQLKRLSKNIKP